jgi:hypothetical protein
MLLRAISCIALVVPTALVLVGCVCSAPVAPSPLPSLSNREVQPVLMSPRTIQPPVTPPDGERVQLRDGDLPFLLFLSADWSHATNRSRLAIHFHTADWFPVDEHLRAGYRFPLVSIFLGAGSARYRGPFLDSERFPRLLKLVEAEQARRGAIEPRVQTVDVSSFSAGYGAVRELVQQPAAFPLIRRLVLSDSLYAGLDTGAEGQGTRVAMTRWLCGVARAHVNLGAKSAKPALYPCLALVVCYFG